MELDGFELSRYGVGRSFELDEFSKGRCGVGRDVLSWTSFS